jgi:hypothetical protein
MNQNLFGKKPPWPLNPLSPKPTAAAILAWLLLSEVIGAWQVLGGILGLFGILVAKRGSPR